MTAIRVLLADDHPVVRNTLAAMLDEEPGIEVVGQACDGQEAVELARELRPDVVLMDITMPRLDGIEATQRISVELPSVQVISLSMHEDGRVIAAMMEAGAVAHLPKYGPLEILLDAIRNAERTATSSNGDRNCSRFDF